MALEGACGLYVLKFYPEKVVIISRPSRSKRISICLQVFFWGLPCVDIYQKHIQNGSETIFEDFEEGTTGYFYSETIELIRSIQRHPIQVTVFHCLEGDEESLEPIGTCKIRVCDKFSEVISRAATCQRKHPYSGSIQGIYDVVDKENIIIGTLKLHMRLTCYDHSLLKSYPLAPPGVTHNSSKYLLPKRTSSGFVMVPADNNNNKTRANGTNGGPDSAQQDTRSSNFRQRMASKSGSSSVPMDITGLLCDSVSERHFNGRSSESFIGQKTYQTYLKKDSRKYLTPAVRPQDPFDKGFTEKAKLEDTNDAYIEEGSSRIDDNLPARKLTIETYISDGIPLESAQSSNKRFGPGELKSCNTSTTRVTHMVQPKYNNLTPVQVYSKTGISDISRQSSMGVKYLQNCGSDFRSATDENQQIAAALCSCSDIFDKPCYPPMTHAADAFSRQEEPIREESFSCTDKKEKGSDTGGKLLLGRKNPDSEHSQSQNKSRFVPTEKQQIPPERTSADVTTETDFGNLRPNIKRSSVQTRDLKRTEEQSEELTSECLQNSGEVRSQQSAAASNYISKSTVPSNLPVTKSTETHPISDLLKGAQQTTMTSHYSNWSKPTEKHQNIAEQHEETVPPKSVDRTKNAEQPRQRRSKTGISSEIFGNQSEMSEQEHIVSEITEESEITKYFVAKQIDILSSRTTGEPSGTSHSRQSEALFSYPYQNRKTTEKLQLENPQHQTGRKPTEILPSKYSTTEEVPGRTVSKYQTTKTDLVAESSEYSSPKATEKPISQADPINTPEKPQFKSTEKPQESVTSQNHPYTESSVPYEVKPSVQLPVSSHNHRAEKQRESMISSGMKPSTKSFTVSTQYQDGAKPTAALHIQYQSKRVEKQQATDSPLYNRDAKPSEPVKSKAAVPGKVPYQQQESKLSDYFPKSKPVEKKQALVSSQSQCAPKAACVPMTVCAPIHPHNADENQPVYLHCQCASKIADKQQQQYLHNVTKPLEMKSELYPQHQHQRPTEPEEKQSGKYAHGSQESLKNQSESSVIQHPTKTPEKLSEYISACPTKPPANQPAYGTQFTTPPKNQSGSCVTIYSAPRPSERQSERNAIPYGTKSPEKQPESYRSEYLTKSLEIQSESSATQYLTEQSGLYATQNATLFKNQSESSAAHYPTKTLENHSESYMTQNPIPPKKPSELTAIQHLTLTPEKQSESYMTQNPIPPKKHSDLHVTQYAANPPKNQPESHVTLPLKNQCETYSTRYPPPRHEKQCGPYVLHPQINNKKQPIHCNQFQSEYQSQYNYRYQTTTKHFEPYYTHSDDSTYTRSAIYQSYQNKSMFGTNKSNDCTQTWNIAQNSTNKSTGCSETQNNVTSGNHDGNNRNNTSGQIISSDVQKDWKFGRPNQRPDGFYNRERVNEATWNFGGTAGRSEPPTPVNVLPERPSSGWVTDARKTPDVDTKKRHKTSHTGRSSTTPGRSPIRSLYVAELWNTLKNERFAYEAFTV